MTQKIQKGSRANNSIPGLEQFVSMFQSRYGGNGSVFSIDLEESYDNFLDRVNGLNQRGAMLLKDMSPLGTNYVERFARGIAQHNLYDPNDKLLLRDILSNLTHLPIVKSEYKKFGGSLKVKLTFSDGTFGITKFMRIPRDIDTHDNTYHNDEYERHTSEIAGFHLDRVLGFHKVIPVVGRLLNMTSDLATFLADTTVVESVYTSPAGNRCFIAHCPLQCGPDRPFCGLGASIEAAVALGLPVNVVGKLVDHPNPFSKPYDFTQPGWLLDDSYCNNTAKRHPSILGSRTFMDLIDLYIFDFLTGNMDRHHFETLLSLGNESFVVHVDNGRGFNRANRDDNMALVILTQCCMIRLTTLAKFIKLYQGPESLSEVMRKSLSSDSLSPILLEPHLSALDRRLAKVIKAISDCIHSGKSWSDVVIEDGVFS
ncbi:hypothetical protein BsWGS_06768 [Bradybaena similaris]